MILFLALLATSIFLLLSGLHVYWAMGGRWGLDAALPDINGERVMTPLRIATWFVAVALFAAALTVLGRLGLWKQFLPQWIFYWGVWALASLFCCVRWAISSS